MSDDAKTFGDLGSLSSLAVVEVARQALRLSPEERRELVELLTQTLDARGSDARE